MAFIRTTDASFISLVSGFFTFPVRPLGFCMIGSKDIGNLLTSKGYTVKYCYEPPVGEWQGHMWNLIENSTDGNWVALDSYYGAITDERYYNPTHSFNRYEQVYDYIPKITIL